MSLVTRNGLSLTAAIFLIWAGGVWLLAVQDQTVPSSYAMVTALLMALTAISTSMINYWKYGRPTIGVESFVIETARARGGIRRGPESREAF